VGTVMGGWPGMWKGVMERVSGGQPYKPSLLVNST